MCWASVVILNMLPRAKSCPLIHYFSVKSTFEMLPTNLCVCFFLNTVMNPQATNIFLCCMGYNKLQFLSTYNYECMSLVKVIPCMILGTFPGSRAKDEPYVWTSSRRISEHTASRTSVFVLFIILNADVANNSRWTKKC